MQNFSLSYVQSSENEAKTQKKISLCTENTVENSLKLQVNAPGMPRGGGFK